MKNNKLWTTILFVIFLNVPLNSFAQLSFTSDTFAIGDPNDTIVISDATMPFFPDCMHFITLEDSVGGHFYYLYQNPSFGSPFPNWVDIVSATEIRVPINLGIDSINSTPLIPTGTYIISIQFKDGTGNHTSTSTISITSQYDLIMIQPLAVFLDSSGMFHLNQSEVVKMGYSTLDSINPQTISGGALNAAYFLFDTGTTDTIYPMIQMLSDQGLLDPMRSWTPQIGIGGNIQWTFVRAINAEHKNTWWYDSLVIEVRSQPKDPFWFTTTLFDTLVNPTAYIFTPQQNGHAADYYRSTSGTFTSDSTVIFTFNIPALSQTEVYDLYMDSGIVNVYGIPFTGVVKSAITVRPKQFALTIKAFYDADGDSIYTAGTDYILSGRTFELLPDQFVLSTSSDTSGTVLFVDTGFHDLVFQPDPDFRSLFYLSGLPIDTFTFALGGDHTVLWPFTTNRPAKSADISCALPYFRCNDWTILRPRVINMSADGAIDMMFCIVLDSAIANQLIPFDTTFGIGDYNYYIGDTIFYLFNNPVMFEWGADKYIPNCGQAGDLVNIQLLLYYVDSLGQRTLLSSLDLSDTVRCGVDPNDKLVSPEGAIQPGDTLIYTIRYQNVGTDTTYNVFVSDTLDPWIDPSSFHLISSSHITATYRTNDALRFEMRNCLLPDSSTNDSASNGYIQYRVIVKPSVSQGTQITNVAHITFDSNSSITTNTTVNTVPILAGVLNEPSIKERNNSYYKNGALYYEGDGFIRITDIQGRTVASGIGNGFIQLPNLQPGVYIYTTHGNSGKFTIINR